VTCTHCGTEIAANALICYRCGHATVDTAVPVSRAPGRAGRGGWVSVAAAIVLVMAALFMGQATAGQAPRWMSWTIGALAAVILVWRVWRRGRI
jgi:hypothetical protein